MSREQTSTTQWEYAVTDHANRWRGILALGAGGLSLIVVIVNFVHTGKVYWGGLVILVLAFTVWRSSSHS